MKKIKLTQGKYTTVDDIDYEWLSQYKWWADKKRKTFYAAMAPSIKDGGHRCILYMHRLILKTPVDMQVDHKDGDGLNNQRSNIRNVTHAENQRNKGKCHNNKSGYKGVCWSKQNKHWVAVIKVNAKAVRLGQFDSKEEAYKAYCEACIKYHGDFANVS